MEGVVLLDNSVGAEIHGDGIVGLDCLVEAGSCCDVAVAQINYPSFKHNTQDSIEQARGRSQD
jgi:hypothetical protein